MAAEKEEEEMINDEMEFIMDGPNESSTKSRSRRPKLVKVISAVVEYQPEPQFVEPPDIRKVRNFTYEIKDAIATVSSKAAVSVKKARIATQVVCEKLYKHHYNLDAQSTLYGQSFSRKPRSAAEYERYKNVLPSEKTVNPCD